jgi:hypothetical protein
VTKAISIQCTAISKQTKQQCKAKAIPGGTVCRWHGGAAGQDKAKAAVRAEILGWGLGDATVDPAKSCSVSSPSQPLELSDMHYCSKRRTKLRNV